MTGRPPFLGPHLGGGGNAALSVNQATNACLTRAAVIGKRRMRLAVAL